MAKGDGRAAALLRQSLRLGCSLPLDLPAKIVPLDVSLGGHSVKARRLQTRNPDVGVTFGSHCPQVLRCEPAGTRVGNSPRIQDHNVAVGLCRSFGVFMRPETRPTLSHPGGCCSLFLVRRNVVTRRSGTRRQPERAAAPGLPCGASPKRHCLSPDGAVYSASKTRRQAASKAPPQAPPARFGLGARNPPTAKERWLARPRVLGSRRA